MRLVSFANDHRAKSLRSRKVAPAHLTRSSLANDKRGEEDEEKERAEKRCRKEMLRNDAEVMQRSAEEMCSSASRQAAAVRGGGDHP